MWQLSLTVQTFIQFKHQVFRKCCSNSKKLGFQDESRQEETIPKRGFVEKKVSFIKYTCIHKRKGSDYSSKKVRTPWTFFTKIRKNTHMSILSQGTDMANKKLAVFTYVYFLLLRLKKAQKIRTASFNSRILLVLL